MKGTSFGQQRRRIQANFSGTHRILESTIRTPANLSDTQRTADLAAVNRKVVGSSPTSGAIF